MEHGTAQGLLIVSLTVKPGWEDEVDRWYVHDHIPEKLAIPGFVDAERYRSVTDDRRLLTVYELSDLRAADVRVPPTEWTTKVKEGWETVARGVWVPFPGDGRA
jgi:hypothetical protein